MNTKNKVVIAADLDEKKVDKQLLASSENLHDLRKQAKRLRYQMELFANYYGDGYANYLAQVKDTQEVLGSMQDSVVLDEWLEGVLESKINKVLPTLVTLIAKNRYEQWLQWQSLQQRFLKLETRHEFHLIVLHPDVK